MRYLYPYLTTVRNTSDEVLAASWVVPLASAACAGSLSVSGVCGSSSAVAVDAGGIG